jgi:acetyltransferase-like isoleucine patch superfamily enzyme
MTKRLISEKRIPWGHLVAFGWMPSFLKAFIYRTFLGYRVGRGVKFGPGSVVSGTDVELGDFVEIGALAVVQGRTIRMGAHSSIGTMSYVSCRVIEMGEDARIREQVYVGGPQLPESRFSLGARTIVLQMAYINPTKPVIIGDDTGIGGHTLIFTHGAWLNAFDGYPADYKPVTIGKSVWFPWRVFVMPGSVVGDGSVIGANSLVSGEIPPYSLAVGSPAKVIRSAPDWPRKPDADARATLAATILSEFDRFTADQGVHRTGDGTVREYRGPGGAGRLHWRRGGDPVPATLAGDTLLSEVALSEAERTILHQRGSYWLDLAGRTRSREGSALTEELALFLGRYGIRLPRA